jgi:hypothetical protein
VIRVQFFTFLVKSFTIVLLIVLFTGQEFTSDKINTEIRDGKEQKFSAELNLESIMSNREVAIMESILMQILFTHKQSGIITQFLVGLVINSELRLGRSFINQADIRLLLTHRLVEVIVESFVHS